MRTSIFLLSLSLAAGARAQTGRGLEEVNFPNSGNAAAQKHFVQGLLWLHSFEYEDAREEFEAAEKADAGFAMAYWGDAMTFNHPLWGQQDREKARAALEKLGPTSEARVAKAATEREKDYVRAVEALYSGATKAAGDAAYVEQMRQVHEKYPQDADAACFYALSILGATEGRRDHAAYMKAAAIVEEVFAAHPRHPGAAHYLIHCYDDPIHAPLGLRPARVYAKLAPAAEHAQHMPSHIFFSLGMWDDVAASNEVSFRVSEDRAARKKLGTEALGYHALSWLEYAYLQQGRYKDAWDRLEIITRNAQGSHSKQERTYLATMRAAYLVETRQWNRMTAPAGVDGLGAEAGAAELFADGMQALAANAGVGVEQTIARIQGLGGGAAVQIAAMELEAEAARKQGRTAEALSKAGKAAEMENALDSGAGPPLPVLPAHELYGELLLESSHAAEAVEQYRVALERGPERARALLGMARAELAAGNREAAGEYFGRLKKAWHRADSEVSAPVMAEIAHAKLP